MPGALRHNARRLRGTRALSILVGLALALAQDARAQTSPTHDGAEAGAALFDLDYLRVYVAVRLGTSVPAGSLAPRLSFTGRGDLYDGSVGVDLGRYTGVEIAFNLYEFDLEESTRGKIGEYSVYTFIPQVRLRYPVLRDRLVPYVVGGVGIGFSEFNDRTLAGQDPSFVTANTTTSLASSLGTGIEYFIARNLAVGIDAKYQLVGRDVVLEGERVDATARALLLSASMRVFFPQNPPPASFPGVRWRRVDRDGVRPYLAFHFGKKAYLSRSFPGGHVMSTAQEEQLNGGSIGVNLTRYVGVELAVESHDTQVWSDTEKLTEYATWNFIPQLRVRYPTLEGKLVPYAVGGIGFGLGQINDSAPANRFGTGQVLSSGGSAAIAAVGGGVDYFVADNVALNVESKYVNQRSSVDVNGISRSVDVSAVQLAAGFRVFFL